MNIPSEWQQTASTEASDRRFIAAAGNGIEVHVLIGLVDCDDRFAVVVCSVETTAEDCVCQTGDWQTVLDYVAVLAA